MYVISISGNNDIEKVMKILKKRRNSIEIEEIVIKIVTDDYKLVAGIKGAGVNAEVVKIKAL